MTIYIHVADIDNFELPLYITAEVDAAPQKGDLITMSFEQRDTLEQLYVDNFSHLFLYEKEIWDRYLFFVDNRNRNKDFDYRTISKEEFKEALDLSNATIVHSREFVISDDTIMPKGLHIYLSL